MLIYSLVTKKTICCECKRTREREKRWEEKNRFICDVMSENEYTACVREREKVEELTRQVSDEVSLIIIIKMFSPPLTG